MMLNVASFIKSMFEMVGFLYYFFVVLAVIVAVGIPFVLVVSQVQIHRLKKQTSTLQKELEQTKERLQTIEEALAQQSK